MHGGKRALCQGRGAARRLWPLVIAIPGAGLVAAAAVVALRPPAVVAHDEGRPPAVSVVSSSPAPRAPAARAGKAPATRHLRARSVVAAPPSRVALPAARVSAAVVPVAGDGDGLQVPPDPRTVGWWAFGAAPGEPGNVVLAGHIDAYNRGVGTFASLTGVRLGQVVEVTDSDGTLHRYRVVARRTYPKQRLPQAVYDRTGAPQLVLVTCGGRFVAGHYDSNIVVYAVPA